MYSLFWETDKCIQNSTGITGVTAKEQSVICQIVEQRQQQYHHKEKFHMYTDFLNIKKHIIEMLDIQPFTIAFVNIST